MQDQLTICPYTGLRSFTEDESLYFKGREEQILQLTSQLEAKKFMMVTGASGDGKSSLIFAGLIPQARAGFFTARYSNWQVADFRPERSPLKNMAVALSRVLGLDQASIEIELSRGFSSLVELYKSSPRYTDINSAAWQQATEEEREGMERKSGNLLILIDQFEEFFTNPENFPGGVPSQESRLLMNIILETAKIALKEDLPIYIVCTMRSDYIGQCAAFRGLPEFIGFSQFFVPRLQRKELYQAIEEPAILSGNRISRRLIDRLIVDVEEGTDQLPILQHALKEIWKAADSGREEMDLVHYAMVGGMHGDHLPKEAQEKFSAWKDQLPEYVRGYLEHPALANVLDIHANKLCEGAAMHCQQHGHPEVTAKQARFIIGMSFACLTRIDESRAVRNRMTLEEITRIINVPSYTTELVGAVLAIFREPENTLIRPFITEEDDRPVTGDTVLDITHEALIRNWKLLKQWSDQEFEYHTTFLDFQQQVNRWIQHGKSDDFLLPIGPLTYFENWYNRCRPNQYWINRYHSSDASQEARLKQSNTILHNGREFLRKSSLRLFVTRTFMKYGAGRIAAVFGLLVFLVVGSIAAYTWLTRQNDYIVDYILGESENVLNDEELLSFDHAVFAAEIERSRPGYLKQVLRALPQQQAIKVGLNSHTVFVQTEPKNPPSVVRQTLVFTDSLIQVVGHALDSSNDIVLNQQLSNLNEIVRNQSYHLYFNPDPEITASRNRNARHQASLILHLLSRPRAQGIINMKALHIAFTDAMNYSGFTDAERASLIDQLSPLATRKESIAKFEEWFPAPEKITVGIATNLSHNGGYQVLAYLYAASGNVQITLRCVDSLKKYNDAYDLRVINSTHIAPHFLIYDQPSACRQFIQAYSKSIGISPHRYAGMLLERVNIITFTNYFKYLKDGNLNDVYTFLNLKVRNQLLSITRSFILEETSADERNLNLALLNKLEGIFVNKKGTEAGIPIGNRSDSLFRVSLLYYNKVSSAFLEEKIRIAVQYIPGLQTLPRKHQFLYPDHFKLVELSIDRIQINYYDDSFFQFLLKNNLFAQLYKDKADYELVAQWIGHYVGGALEPVLHYPDPGLHTFEAIDSLVRISGYDIENAWVQMKLILDYFESGDTTRAYALSKSLKYQTVEGNYSFQFKSLVIRVATELAVRGKHTESMKLVGTFASRKNRVQAYATISLRCQRREYFQEATMYFDSANAELSRQKDFVYVDDDFRTTLVEILTLQNTKASRAQALEYIGSMQQFNPANGIYNMSRAYSGMGNYYNATTVLPSHASYFDKVIVYLNILYHDTNSRKENSKQWAAYRSAMAQRLEITPTQNDLLPD